MEAKNQPTADFIRIVVWGKQGENAANFLSKGRLVGIQGRLQTGSYDKDDGTRIYTTDIVANNVEFLEYADNQNSSGANYDDIPGFHPTDEFIPF